MPLYELFCIASHNPASPHNLRQLIEGLGRQIHNGGGVVRDLKNLGIGLQLPNKTRRHQQTHTRGDHFLMTFDCSPPALNKMNTQLAKDPLVIKWTALRRGGTLPKLLPKLPTSIEFDDVGSQTARI